MFEAFNKPFGLFVSRNLRKVVLEQTSGLDPSVAVPFVAEWIRFTIFQIILPTRTPKHVRLLSQLGMYLASINDFHAVLLDNHCSANRSLLDTSKGSVTVV